MGFLQGGHAVRTVFPWKALPALTVPWCFKSSLGGGLPLGGHSEEPFKNLKCCHWSVSQKEIEPQFFEVQRTLYQEYVMCLDIFWCVFHYNNAITWAAPNDRVNSLRLFSCPFLSQHSVKRTLQTMSYLYVASALFSFPSNLFILNFSFLYFFFLLLTFLWVEKKKSLSILLYFLAD